MMSRRSELISLAWTTSTPRLFSCVCRGEGGDSEGFEGFRGVRGVQSNPHLIQNFIFMENFGYGWQIWDTIFTLNIHNLYSLPYTFLQKVNFTAYECIEIAGWVTNKVHPDQTPRSAASDMGLHCLLRPVCPITYSKYGNLIKSNP